MTLPTVVQRPCAECGEDWPLEEFRVGTSSYSQHCGICRLIVQDRIAAHQETLRMKGPNQ